MFKEMLSNSYLFGANAPFIEQLYESYLQDPAAVEPRWRDYFEELQRLEQGPRDVAHTPIQEAFVRLAKERRGGDGRAAPAMRSSIRSDARRSRTSPSSIRPSTASARPT